MGPVKGSGELNPLLVCTNCVIVGGQLSHLCSLLRLQSRSTVVGKSLVAPLLPEPLRWVDVALKQIQPVAQTCTRRPANEPYRAVLVAK